ISIAEIAHVFSAADAGPRADVALSAEKRGAYDNLILLFPTYHTVVDNAPAAYPGALILEWKHRHIQKPRPVFGARSFVDRKVARAELAPMFEENRTIHELYGPDNDYRHNPESEEAALWKRKVKTRILPNNRRILALLDANRGLLNPTEHGTLELLRQHI